MPVKRVLITAGGTGGHLYPAQALAQQLMGQKSMAPDVLFVAGGLGANRYFDRNRFSYQEIACSPLKSVKGVVHLLKGIRQSVAILKKYRPHVVVGFGSYYSVAVLLAAKWLKIPIILHEANSIPGRANRWLAPLATHVGLHFPSAAPFFKVNTVEVGLPLREGYSLSAVAKEKALDYYGLPSQGKTLLICGGSQGAQAINRLIKDCLSIFQRLSLQIIHLTGDLVMAATLRSLYDSCRIPAHVKSFETEMQMAWRAADGFVGRSGASTIAESIEFEVPGILIPYPYATDHHQEKNADFLVDEVKSALKLSERGLTPKQLGEVIETLYEPERFFSFKKALEAYKKRTHRMTLCQLILNMEPFPL
jgi:UDP-N-acetylglucosamine--N-acetylmuramyl-(pentapeptide) pyrophosphoryl-undecaprenol N-acetylglucosamine transferase